MVVGSMGRQGAAAAKSLAGAGNTCGQVAASGRCECKAAQVLWCSRSTMSSSPVDGPATVVGLACTGP